LSGEIVNLFIKPKHGGSMQAMDELSAVDGKGLQGDTSFGRGTRQVLLLELETLNEFGLQPGRLKENVTTQGLALAGMAPGSRIQVGQAVLEVTGDCAPCQYVEDIRPGLQEEMRGRRGTLCRVMTGGTLRPGDPVTILHGD